MSSCNAYNLIKPYAICWQVRFGPVNGSFALKRLLRPVAPWMRWSTRAPAFALWPHVLVTPEVHRVEVGMSAGLWAYAE